MTRPPRLELVDYIRELTQPHVHREHYQIQRGQTWYGQDHVVKTPSLLQQLWENDTPSGATEDGRRPGYQSKPAARLDALDTAARIDIEAARWVTDLGETPRSRDTADLVLQLHGLAASADPVTQREIERDVKRWWLRARIVTGWDDPAWTPDATCPQCGMRGSLRVRLPEHIALCTQDGCRATWAEDTIGILADHIRSESSAERRSSDPEAMVCWCPLEQPSIGGLSILCPRCRSARCRHAVTAMNLLVADVLLGASSADLAKRYRLARKTAVRLIQRVRYGREQVSA